MGIEDHSQMPGADAERLRISVHERFRVQDLTPPHPASCYSNQLVNSCKCPEVGSLSQEALIVGVPESSEK